MEMTRTAGVVLLVASAFTGLVACGDDDDAASSGDDVSGIVWELTEMNGVPVPDGVTATLEYDGTSVSGSGGCNTYNGEASFDDGVVTISPQLASTMMACPPPADQFEFDYLQVLPTAMEFEVDGGSLTLYSDDETVLVYAAPA